jgi:hypothetical protein
MARFAEELGNHNGHSRAITQVAIDMSPAYQKWSCLDLVDKC